MEKQSIPSPFKIGRLAVEAPKSHLGDDAAVFARFAGVGGDGLVGGEVFIALDGETERAAEVAQFVHAHESEFRRSHTEVAKTEGDVIESELLGPHPGPSPCGPA